jgi:hypothetical protein
MVKKADDQYTRFHCKHYSRILELKIRFLEESNEETFLVPYVISQVLNIALEIMVISWVLSVISFFLEIGQVKMLVDLYFCETRLLVRVELYSEKSNLLLSMFIIVRDRHAGILVWIFEPRTRKVQDILNRFEMPKVYFSLSRNALY